MMFQRLGFSNGGYINPPIVFMVVGIPGIYAYIHICTSFDDECISTDEMGLGFGYQ